VRHRIFYPAALAVIVAAVSVSCGGGSNGTPAPTAPTPTPSATLTAPKPESPAAGEQLATLRPTLTVQNVTSDQATGTRSYEFQISDTTSFSAITTSSEIRGFDAQVGKTGVPEGAGGKTSYTIESDLQPTTAFFWRVRAVQGTTVGPWSETFRFKSKLMGFSRAGELYDPLIHGETVGTVVGSATFLPGQGLRLDTGNGGVIGYVRYALPQTISNGEFSMDVEGLRPNAPGDKAKVFGMQQGPDDSDFVTNKYRIDIQYRGITGVPPNCIQFRVLYGSATDTSVRYEPDANDRNAAVRLLNPTTKYYWQATWGSVFRLFMREGGAAGSGVTQYDKSIATPKGAYLPSPHYAYLGAPPARSGPEAASIPGSIYSNVWISSRPRPDSLGSALK
jgi:hypothetical protein